MSRNAAYEQLMWAMAAGAAVTPDQVDLARRGAIDLSALADDVSAGAAVSMPDAPTTWRSDAGAAYASELNAARLALVSASAILADAAAQLSSTSWRLQDRLDEQNAILIAGPDA